MDINHLAYSLSNYVYNNIQELYLCNSYALQELSNIKYSTNENIKIIQSNYLSVTTSLNYLIPMTKISFTEMSNEFNKRASIFQKKLDTFYLSTSTMYPLLCNIILRHSNYENTIDYIQNNINNLESNIRNINNYYDSYSNVFFIDIPDHMSNMVICSEKINNHDLTIQNISKDIKSLSNVLFNVLPDLQNNYSKLYDLSSINHTQLVTMYSNIQNENSNSKNMSDYVTSLYISNQKFLISHIDVIQYFSNVMFKEKSNIEYIINDLENRSFPQLNECMNNIKCIYTDHITYSNVTFPYITKTFQQLEETQKEITEKIELVDNKISSDRILLDYQTNIFESTYEKLLYTSNNLGNLQKFEDIKQVQISISNLDAKFDSILELSNNLKTYQTATINKLLSISDNYEQLSNIFNTCHDRSTIFINYLCNDVPYILASTAYIYSNLEYISNISVQLENEKNKLSCSHLESYSNLTKFISNADIELNECLQNQQSFLTIYSIFSNIYNIQDTTKPYNVLNDMTKENNTIILECQSASIQMSNLYTQLMFSFSNTIQNYIKTYNTKYNDLDYKITILDKEQARIRNKLEDIDSFSKATSNILIPILVEFEKSKLDFNNTLIDYKTIARNNAVKLASIEADHDTMSMSLSNIILMNDKILKYYNTNIVIVNESNGNII